jgi:hypothetical protein
MASHKSREFHIQQEQRLGPWGGMDQRRQARQQLPSNWWRMKHQLRQLLERGQDQWRRPLLGYQWTNGFNVAGRFTTKQWLWLLAVVLFVALHLVFGRLPTT